MGRMFKRGGKAVLACAATAMLLAGCQTVRTAPERLFAWGKEPSSPPPGQIEPVRAAAVVNNLAVFWVTSNGCTTKTDLQPVVSRRGGASVVSLRRINEDRCSRPAADGIELQWSFEELGLEPGSAVTVETPYQLSPGV